MRRCLVLLQLFNFSAAKLKCYYDRIKLPDSRRISAWRDFKYPVQCQHECLYSGIYNLFIWSSANSNFSKPSISLLSLYIGQHAAVGVGLDLMQVLRTRVIWHNPRLTSNQPILTILLFLDQKTALILRSMSMAKGGCLESSPQKCFKTLLIKDADPVSCWWQPKKAQLLSMEPAFENPN